MRDSANQVLLLNLGLRGYFVTEKQLTFFKYISCFKQHTNLYKNGSPLLVEFMTSKFWIFAACIQQSKNKISDFGPSVDYSRHFFFLKHYSRHLFHITWFFLLDSCIEFGTLKMMCRT